MSRKTAQTTNKTPVVAVNLFPAFTTYYDRRWQSAFRLTKGVSSLMLLSLDSTYNAPIHYRTQSYDYV